MIESAVASMMACAGYAPAAHLNSSCGRSSWKASVLWNSPGDVAIRTRGRVDSFVFLNDNPLPRTRFLSLFGVRRGPASVSRLRAVQETTMQDAAVADPEVKPARRTRRTQVKKTTSTTTSRGKARVAEKEKKSVAPGLNLDKDVDDDEGEGEKVTDWPPLVCCFGEALYEFLPSVRVSTRQMHPDIYSTWKGLQWSPPEFARLPGSLPSNVAVALARLGGRVAFMGKVGDDDHGHDLVLKLNTNGVQTRAVKFDSSCSTGVSRLRLTTGAGKVSMTCVRPSAEDSFVKSEINMDVLKETRLFQFTSLSLTSEPMRSTLFSAIKMAKKNGADILFDVNLPLGCWRSVEASRELIRDAWKEANIVEVSKQELEFIVDEEYYEKLRQKRPQYFSDTIEQTKKRRRYHYHYHPEEISPLWHKKMKLLIVTDGLFRIHYYTPHFHGEVEGTEDVLVSPFTCDRTGSGDAFIAAIMRKLSSQPEVFVDEVKLQKALRFCICTGIIAQWTKGAIRGMPTESAALNLTEQTPSQDQLAEKADEMLLVGPVDISCLSDHGIATFSGQLLSMVGVPPTAIKEINCSYAI